MNYGWMVRGEWLIIKCSLFWMEMINAFIRVAVAVVGPYGPSLA
jgi:hypothetical protein